MTSPQENITRFWSTVAPSYEAHQGNVPHPESPEHRAWVDAIRALLPPPPADVLDIATGTGFLATIAAELGHRVTGIDLAEPMLAEARANAARRGLTVAFASDDAVAPSFPAASFDAITCRHFLWTLREPEKAFANWRTLLRPGGRVAAIDGFWFRDEGPSPDPEDFFNQHYTPETRAALPAMALAEPGPIVEGFRRAGFNPVTLDYLAEVHALAEDPPGAQPWYVVTGWRPQAEGGGEQNDIKYSEIRANQAADSGVPPLS